LIALTPGKKDWEHPRIIIDSNPKIPSRGRYLELNETDPIPYIRQSILNLYDQGARVIAVVCNTAHILYPHYASDLPPDLQIPNMVNETAQETVRQLGRAPQRVAVFSSRLTQQYNLYGQAFAPLGGDVLNMKATQEEVSSLIEAVKQGHPLAENQQRMRAVLNHYPQADAFILGCTELSLLLTQADCAIPLIDSNLALAKTCLLLARAASCVAR
jgi:aspartate racemase